MDSIRHLTIWLTGHENSNKLKLQNQLASIDEQPASEANKYQVLNTKTEFRSHITLWRAIAKPSVFRWLLVDNGDEEGKFGMTMNMHSPYQQKTYHHASRWKTVNGNNLVYDFVTQEPKRCLAAHTNNQQNLSSTEFIIPQEFRLKHRS